MTTYQPDEVAAAAQTADVMIVLNWGLHYQVMAQYKKELGKAFEVLDQHAAQAGQGRALLGDGGAQHFKASDARGYTHGEWESETSEATPSARVSPSKTSTSTLAIRCSMTCWALAGSPTSRCCPSISSRAHGGAGTFGNCTHRPNGWNYETCCDCTHFCFSPAMWHAHLASVKAALLQSPGVGTKLASAM